MEQAIRGESCPILGPTTSTACRTNSSFCSCRWTNRRYLAVDVNPPEQFRRVKLPATPAGSRGPLVTSGVPHSWYPHRRPRSIHSVHESFPTASGRVILKRTSMLLAVQHNPVITGTLPGGCTGPVQQSGPGDDSMQVVGLPRRPLFADRPSPSGHATNRLTVESFLDDRPAVTAQARLAGIRPRKLPPRVAVGVVRDGWAHARSHATRL
mgnify:CR=1 FL=1